MGRIAVQGLPKSHVGPQSYRHISISVITYAAHCAIYVTQQKLTVAGAWDRETLQIIIVFKQSGFKDVCNLHTLILPAVIHIAVTGVHQYVCFPYCCKRQAGQLHAGAVPSLTNKQTLSPLPPGPSTAPQAIQ